MQTKLERLEKAVADTTAAYAAYAGGYANYIAAWSAWNKARDELSNYKKEQDNADVKDH